MTIISIQEGRAVTAIGQVRQAEGSVNLDWDGFPGFEELGRVADSAQNPLGGRLGGNSAFYTMNTSNG